LLTAHRLPANFAAISGSFEERAGNRASPAFFWTLLLLMFALTLVPAALRFLTVERPFSLAPQRRGRRPAVCGERGAAILVGSAAPQGTGRAP